MNLICIGLILGFAVSGFSQKQDPSGPENTRTASRNGDRGAVINSGTSIEGQLQSSLDVKKAKVGDEVVLKTTKSIKQDGQVVVPKGSRLIGRITDVQEKTKSNGTSRLGMVFDRVENKDMSSPISASIVSIINVASNARLSDTANADVFGSSSSNASARSTGGGSSGGGLLGGAGGVVGGVTGSAGNVLNTTTNTIGGVAATTGQTVGTTTGSTVRTVNGIQITNSVDGSLQSGSSLSAANRNIRLEKGVTLQLLVNSSVDQQ